MSDQTRVILIVLLLFVPCACASSVILSVSDPVQVSVPVIPGSQSTNAWACIDGTSTRSCGIGNPPQSAAVSGASAYATGPSDEAAPKVLTAGGQISLGEVAPGYELFTRALSSFTLATPQAVTDYSLFPSIQAWFSPGALSGSVYVDVRQEAPLFTPGTTTVFGSLRLIIGIGGSSDASFTLDPVTGIMALSVLSGSNGYVDLTLDRDDPGQQAIQVVHMINFRFDSTVTESSNTLGLALPGVGELPSFSIPVNAFAGSLEPVLSGSTGSSVYVEGYLGRYVPEPASLGLLSIGLAGLTSAAARARRRISP